MKKVENHWPKASGLHPTDSTQTWNPSGKPNLSAA